MIYEIGRPYYSFGFHDRELKLLKIESWVYLGSELDVYGNEEGRSGYVCFQDAESYAEFGAYSGLGDHISEKAEVVIISHREDDTEGMIDIFLLIEKLRNEQGRLSE